MIESLGAQIYKVHEIFSSIEGEGKRVGQFVTFIRLHGCNLSCSYCDTRYSCDGEEYTEMTLEEILEVVKEEGLKRISLTGGEPLIHPHVMDLLEALVFRGHEINVETNGSVDLEPFKLNPELYSVFLTMDYKGPSSGMEQEMKLKNFKLLDRLDCIKFVVGPPEDLIAMKSVLATNRTSAEVFVSPIFGQIQPVEIVEYLVQNKLTKCRVQIQLHKIIYPPDMRGV